jgi:hypothetical protein
VWVSPVSLLGIIYILGFYVVLTVTALCAARWGGWVERTAALLFIGAAVATRLLFLDFGRHFVGLETRVLLVDLALLATLCALTMRVGYGWLICAASAQAITTLAHFSKLLMLDLSRLGYALMEGASSWPTVIALAVGVWQHHHRRRVRRKPLR